MIENRKDIVRKLDKAINKNPFCSGNIMLQNRVFLRDDTITPEILVSLNNRSKKPHYWGHLYEKEGVYISCLIAINYWLNPLTKKQLFEECWDCLNKKGTCYPIGGNRFGTSKKYNNAVKCLAKLIKNFTEESK